MSLSEVHMCLWVCSDPSKIHSFLWVDSRAKSTQSPRSLCLIKARVCEHLDLPDQWSFRPPQAITDIHRLKHATVVKKGSGGKPLGMPTGSLVPRPKAPTGEVNHLLEALKPRGPRGSKPTALDSRSPVSSSILGAWDEVRPQCGGC